jgi:hypothetical protein
METKKIYFVAGIIILVTAFSAIIL